jgi:hypothetical protein
MIADVDWKLFPHAEQYSPETVSLPQYLQNIFSGSIVTFSGSTVETTLPRYIERLPYAMRSAPTTMNIIGIARNEVVKFAPITAKTVRKPIMTSMVPALIPILPKALTISVFILLVVYKLSRIFL